MKNPNPACQAGSHPFVFLNFEKKCIPRNKALTANILVTKLTERCSLYNSYCNQFTKNRDTLFYFSFDGLIIITFVL